MFEVVKKALAVKVAATAPELSTQEECARRAEELFQEQQHEIYRNTDQLFARLMLVQWVAAIVMALDHFLRGIYWPYSVYGVLAASPWRSMEHAAWVVFEDLFLVISCFRSIREMRSIANRTAALEASEQTFRQIFQDGPMGIALVDLEQRFVKVNASLCQMMGFSAEELIGKNTLDLTCPE